MRSSRVLVFVFLVVAKDALHTSAAEQAVVHMWVRCKMPDDRDRTIQTIAVKIGQAKDDIFTFLRYVSER